MTIKELEAKLAETEKQLAVANGIIERMAQADGLVISVLYPYKCKICTLYHFPEPVKKCERVEDNNAMREQTERERERYLTEFKAALKRSTDERGELGWRFIDEYL